MNINVYVANLRSRITELIVERAETTDTDRAAELDSEIAEATAEFDEFAEWAVPLFTESP